MPCLWGLGWGGLPVWGAGLRAAMPTLTTHLLTHSPCREYTGAVEAKQVAQQDAERAKFIVEKAEQDKQSAIIRAQGEAQSALLIGQAVQQVGGCVQAGVSVGVGVRVRAGEGGRARSSGRGERRSRCC